MTLFLALVLLALVLALVNMTAWWFGIDIAGVGGVGDDPEASSHDEDAAGPPGQGGRVAAHAATGTGAGHGAPPGH